MSSADREYPGHDLAAAVHALLMASPAPLSQSRLMALTGADREAVAAALATIRSFYAGGPGGAGLQEIAGGWQLTTDPAFGELVAALGRGRQQPLSPAALEALAVIAYRQPVTRAEIEQVRGVGSDGVVITLMERGLVREVGRKTAPGRPLLYGTTDEFLRFIGIRTLADLPELEDEGEDGPLPMLHGPNR